MKVRLQKFWNRLHWKLTLSYTLVTVAALMVVQILAVIFIWLIVMNSRIYPRALVTLTREEIVPQIAVYLDEPEPDLNGLAGWLQAAETSAGLTFQSLNFPVAQISLSDFDENIHLLVLGEELNFLAGIPKTTKDKFREILNQSDGIVKAALGGEIDPNKISQIIPSQYMTIAVPVMNGLDEILGVVVLRTVYPPQGLLVGMLSYIGGSLIFFTLAAGGVGTVFGFITSNGLTRRLSRIAEVTNQWSQGKFKNYIQQRSGDELGELTLSLNRMAEQLQNLLHTRQELAALEERNRLARDLHDGVKQQVFATSMQLGVVRALLNEDIEKAKKHLDQAEKLTHQTQAELTEIIRELRPATLDREGLVPAIKEQLDTWIRLNKISVTMNVKANRRISGPVEQALFRVTQEAFSNIARHSNATQVELEIIYEDAEIMMSITDDGIGFDTTNDVGEGLGLRSMRERIYALGGEFNIESDIGQGTRLVARCPIVKGVVQ